jgi:hypothetical protein
MTGVGAVVAVVVGLGAIGAVAAAALCVAQRSRRRRPAGHDLTFRSF